MVGFWSCFLDTNGRWRCFPRTNSIWREGIIDS
uniref:Uncharacterized protein n=1 Tax=Siphoviridae sp. cteoh1 TaxID=2826407 RepID=A0A8S5QLX5_9CAUD|nr:MAG TPA: hypothetical protein [Siphoviridae sp. cteoh1]